MYPRNLRKSGLEFDRLLGIDPNTPREDQMSIDELAKHEQQKTALPQDGNVMYTVHVDPQTLEFTYEFPNKEE
ncbi:hypothetical protein HOC32_04590 [Candidatus Woesearchaeota archaeon]|jgi:hypothetical protein|nr:hypothetical protein [Candidatus Woesearchaeota archaeon]